MPIVRRTDSANRFDNSRRLVAPDTPPVRPAAPVHTPSRPGSWSRPGNLPTLQGTVMDISAKGRRALSASLVALALTGVAACSSDNGSPGSSAGGTYTIWDPYPQYDD